MAMKESLIETGGFFVDAVANFGGFEHALAPSMDKQD
jgi:hypothetical protein